MKPVQEMLLIDPVMDYTAISSITGTSMVVCEIYSLLLSSLKTDIFGNF